MSLVIGLSERLVGCESVYRFIMSRCVNVLIFVELS